MIDTRHRVGVVGWSHGRGGVHHFRIAEPLRVLAEHGNHTVITNRLDDEILSTVDTVLAHTLHEESDSEAWETLAKVGEHRLVYDVDDAMWAPDWKPFADHYTPDLIERIYRNAEIAHVVTTPSDVIAEHLSRYNGNVHVVPNTVPAWLLSREEPEDDRRPAIGYQGSSSHQTDWRQSDADGMVKFLVAHPEWDLRWYGPQPGELVRLPQVRHQPWIPSIHEYYRRVTFDIGIGPLRDTKFNAAKSSLRAVEYAAIGACAVLPDLPPYRGWVEPGVTGVLVQPHQTLRGVLDRLCQDWDAIRGMGAQARIRAQEWTTEAAIGKWVRAWHSL